MREKNMHDSSVYHLCAGPQLEEFAVLNSYDEYIAQFMQLKANHKGTRYMWTKLDRNGRVYHHYLRVVVLE